MERSIDGKWHEYEELYRECFLDEPLTEFINTMQKILSEIPTEEHHNIYIEYESPDYDEYSGMFGGGMVVYKLHDKLHD